MQLKDLTRAIAETFGTWREYDEMVDELSRLPDHALADLGTTRREIREFARRWARRDAARRATPAHRTPPSSRINQSSAPRLRPVLEGRPVALMRDAVVTSFNLCRMRWSGS